MPNRLSFAAGLALALAAPAVAPTTAFAKPAGPFLIDAIRGDNSEVALGQLAQRRGGSPVVRDFGRMLAADHGAAKVAAVNAARRERVRVPGGMKPEAQALYNRLSRLDGRAFDRVFVSAMIADHRKDIAAFEAQARTGDPITRRLAADTLPTLRKHLDMALRAR